jgi:hypothetical protein
MRIGKRRSDKRALKVIGEWVLLVGFQEAISRSEETLIGILEFATRKTR